MASIPPLNPRATTAGDSVATAATGFEGSFRLQSFNRFGSMERAPKVCLFICISSSRDRLKFETPFLKFSNENADLAPLRPYCGWAANGGGRCECHVRRGVVPFQRGMRELAFFALFSSEMFIFSCSHPP